MFFAANCKSCAWTCQWKKTEFSMISTLPHNTQMVKKCHKCKQGAKPLVSMSVHTWGLRNWGTWARRLGWDELRGGTDGWGGGCCCRARACAAPLLPNTPLCIYTNTHKKFIRKQTSWGYAQSCHALILLVQYGQYTNIYRARWTMTNIMLNNSEPKKYLGT